ncbi:MAG: polysaccharide deacetylase family protein, partial [Parachlamydiales bacterium]
MLINLLFHKIKPAYSPLLEKTFQHLERKYPILLPGEKIPPFKTSLCLTFDDGYFDFYYYVFPLLKKLKLKALLAVSAGTLQEKSQLAPEKRLALLENGHFFPGPKIKEKAFCPNSTALAGQALKAKGKAAKKNILPPADAFCSCDELKEMLQSGLVQIASHSFSHASLTRPETDLKKEVLFSKMVLEEKLQAPIQSFVYPYGHFDPSIHRFVKKHYRYIFRIGSALNFSWHNF